MMIGFGKQSLAGILATAAIVAVAITAYGTQATGHGSGAKDPTAVISYDKAGVGGRKGCDVQSWPYIAPECLVESDAAPKPVRRLL